MFRRAHRVIFCCLLLTLIPLRSSLAEELRSSRDLAPDQPGEDDLLNRQLWQHARQTSYEEAERYVASAQEASPKLRVTR
jgi:hypothetical protein